MKSGMANCKSKRLFVSSKHSKLAMKKKIYTCCFLYTFIFCGAIAQDTKSENYWELADGKSITWDLTKEEKLPHKDNIELSGKKVSVILYYEIDTAKNLSITKDVIFPQLRTYNKSNEPDWKKYRAYFRKKVGNDANPAISYNEKLIIPSKIDSVKISGMLTFYCTPVDGLMVTKTIYPSMENRFLVEQWDVKNIDNTEKTVFFTNYNLQQKELGYKGTYRHEVYSNANDRMVLAPNESYSFPMYYGATLNEEKASDFDFKEALKERKQYLKTIRENLVLQTPDEIINTLFYFSKIRASESIFDSSMGLVHSPGGGNYYTGIWANDQVEYSGPFFPYLGYKAANTAAFNTYQKFLENIPKEDTHIPYAFEVDGIFPMKHLDRGDAAMIVYGTSLYLLSTGDIAQSKQLWPLIEWSIAYCHKKRNKEGAVQSASDEMEGRIETGTANLSTSTLYYGGLRYASRLAKELKLFDKASLYEKRADEMEKVIENYFGSTMEGLETYKYFEENNLLRHWICLPLTMGIDKRKEGTLAALFKKLWTKNGILVELNPEVPVEKAIFWDRATLYALRGAMKVGEVNLAYDKLKSYSQKRLLGDHVPYAIEAFPENNMKHLSAESALYCRIITEGLLGIEPMGFGKTQLSPSLPEAWDYIELKNVYISDKPMDISVKRKERKLQVKVVSDGKVLLNKSIKNGNSIMVIH